MSGDEIIDYSHQGNVNRAFALILIIVTVFAILLRLKTSEYESIVLTLYSIIPVGLMVVSAFLGALSKRAIDYVEGDWEERKTWVSFSEYRRMVEEYEDAYGHLYGNPGGCVGLFFMLPLAFALGFLSSYYQTLASPLFDPIVDSLLIIVILYSVVAVIGFVIGFRIPSIDAEEFFKPPVKGDVYNFASQLEQVPEIRAGLNVELGVRSGVQTILGAEVKTYVEGLPDTVSIQVQVSHSGFAYPYLVGTVFKGSPVPSSKDHYRINTRYPALVETSMDGEVSVFVARFDIPSRTSSVPSISKRDFRNLASLLAVMLKGNYDGSR
ncbi:MAG: hypothetical protein ACE5H4_13045 [Candidatus Thorarchaeota archaeon]